MKYKKLRCDLFFVDVYLFVGNAEKAHTKALKVIPGYCDVSQEYHIGGRYGCNIVWTDEKTGEYIFILWFKKNPDIDTFVHEINHLVRSIFQCVGIPVSNDTEEIESYLEGYWARRIKKALK